MPKKRAVEVGFKHYAAIEFEYEVVSETADDLSSTMFYSPGEKI